MKVLLLTWFLLVNTLKTGVAHNSNEFQENYFCSYWCGYHNDMLSIVPCYLIKSSFLTFSPNFNDMRSLVTDFEDKVCSFINFCKSSRKWSLGGKFLTMTTRLLWMKNQYAFYKGTNPREYSCDFYSIIWINQLNKVFDLMLYVECKHPYKTWENGCRNKRYAL